MAGGSTQRARSRAVSLLHGMWQTRQPAAAPIHLPECETLHCPAPQRVGIVAMFNHIINGYEREKY